MNIPGIPGRGVNGGSSGMSEQEQLMVKSVCLPTSANDLRAEEWFIDASCHGKLPSEDCTGWWHGLRFRWDVWTFHV